MKSNIEQTLEKMHITKKPTRKQLGIAGGIVVILLVIIVGFGVYNSPTNRLSRQIDLGQRYLEEQNYEQAVVEFDKAIAIDPMSVEAYLGKAEAYEGLGDIDMAIHSLEEGYERTGDERLLEKMNEVQEQLDQNGQVEETALLAEEEMFAEQIYIVLPFSISDIKFMGYDLFEPYFDELVAKFEITMNSSVDGSGSSFDWGSTDNQYGKVYADDFSGRRDISILDISNNDHAWYTWLVYANNTDQNSNQLDLYDNTKYTGKSNRSEMESICDLPIYVGDTYEEWCEKLKIKEIKSSVEGRFNEEYQELEWNSVNELQQFLTEDGWYVYSYRESEERLPSTITLHSEEGLSFFISAYFEDGIIVAIHYTLFLTRL